MTFAWKAAGIRLLSKVCARAVRNALKDEHKVLAQRRDEQNVKFAKWDQGKQGDFNYGMIEEDLYRSGQPNELNFPFLEKLGLKTVVWLAPEEPNQRFINFIDDQEIHFYHLGVISSTTNAWDPITEEVVLEALELILNSHNYPMIIMCNLGRHRTGTIVGCLRKLQRWNLTSIFEEYRRYAGPKVRVLNEQFIELFDTDLGNPSQFICGI
nr:7677_t:CDS:2 [Entrophospora candida]